MCVYIYILYTCICTYTSDATLDRSFCHTARYLRVLSWSSYTWSCARGSPSNVRRGRASGSAPFAASSPGSTTPSTLPHTLTPSLLEPPPPPPPRRPLPEPRTLFSAGKGGAPCCPVAGCPLSSALSSSPSCCVYECVSARVLALSRAYMSVCVCVHMHE